MISQLLIIAFVLICTITITYSYSIEIKPGSIECFYITATIGSPITGSYEVIHPDPKYISILVSDHNNKIHYKKKVTTELDEENKEDASEGFFSFDAEINGDYKMCLANGHKDENDGVSRLIAFNFRAASIGQQDYQFVGLQSELADLKEGLDLLKDHQSYMNQREDVHKEVLESINTKVLCWTVLEAIILVAMALWQITYIRSFFEIKRRL